MKKRLITIFTVIIMVLLCTASFATLVMEQKNTKSGLVIGALSVAKNGQNSIGFADTMIESTVPQLYISITAINPQTNNLIASRTKTTYNTNYNGCSLGVPTFNSVEYRSMHVVIHNDYTSDSVTNSIYQW